MRLPYRHYLALIALATALGAPFALPALLSPADPCLAADEAASRYEFELALFHLRGALRGKPHSPAVVYLMAARMARRVERLKEAEEHLAEAARLGADARALGLERALLWAQQGYAARVRDGLADCLEPEGPDSELVWEASARPCSAPQRTWTPSPGPSPGACASGSWACRRARAGPRCGPSSNPARSGTSVSRSPEPAEVGP